MRASDLFNDELPGADIYEVEEEIGHGTFSEVHKARHKTTGQVVALKHTIFANPGIRPLEVQRELEALEALQGNSNVVSLLDTCEEKNGICLVMQHCLADLGTLLARTPGAPLPSPIIKAIMLHLLQALQACHDKDILHRDVSPYNILFDDAGGVRLSDFGQARRHPPPLSSALPSSSSGQPIEDMLSPTVGTQWYRAPELLFGARQYSAAVDVWGAGCIFAELLTGRPLFPGSSDIDQICKIRDALGSPSPEVWPGIEALPDWGKLVFPPKDALPWNEVVGGVEIDASAIGLLGGLLRYDPASRLTARQALQEDYFIEKPAPAEAGDIKAAVESLKS